MADLPVPEVAVAPVAAALASQPALHGFRLLQGTSTGRLPSLNEVHCSDPYSNVVTVGFGS